MMLISLDVPTALSTVTAALSATSQARDTTDYLRGLSDKPAHQSRLHKAIALSDVAAQQATQAAALLSDRHDVASMVMGAVDALSGALVTMVDEPGTPSERADIAVDQLDNAYTLLNQALHVIEQSTPGLG